VSILRQKKIENIYIRANPVMQVYVHGESLQATLLAFVVPDPDSFESWCSNLGFKGNLETLCKNSNVKKAVLGDINAIGKSSALKSFEMAKSIHLDPAPWTVESGLITPTFKSKRPQLKAFYQDNITEMYKVLNS